MDRLNDEQTVKWTDLMMYSHIPKFNTGQTDRWANKWTDRWADKWQDRWVVNLSVHLFDGQTNWPIDGQTDLKFDRWTVSVWWDALWRGTLFDTRKSNIHRMLIGVSTHISCKNCGARIRCKNWCSIGIYFIFPQDCLVWFYFVTFKHNFGLIKNLHSNHPCIYFGF